MVFIEGGSVVASRVQKVGIWTFNFQLTANEVGGVDGGGGGNHEYYTEPYGVSSEFNRDTASRFFHFWLIFPKLSVTLNTMQFQLMLTSYASSEEEHSLSSKICSKHQE